MAAAATPVAEHNVTTETVSERARWQPVMELGCELTVDLVLPRCTVRDFLALQPGAVLPTRWGVVRDVPLKINGILIGWGELEGAGTRLAVRVTELA